MMKLSSVTVRLGAASLLELLEVIRTKRQAEHCRTRRAFVLRGSGWVTSRLF